MANNSKRLEALMPGGIPRWIRCFDNGGETWDRYSVEFTRPNDFGMSGYVVGRGMSANPFHPGGFGQWFEMRAYEIGRKRSHWGKRVKFQDLPEAVKRCITQDYRELRSLN
jgi:hypothetical protein